MIKPGYKVFRIVWVSSMRQVLTTYRLARTQAEAVASFYKTHPHGHMAHISAKP